MESHEFSSIPKVLIDTVPDLTPSYNSDEEITIALCLFNLRSLFIIRLLSKSTVSDKNNNESTNIKSELQYVPS